MCSCDTTKCFNLDSEENPDKDNCLSCVTQTIVTHLENLKDYMVNVKKLDEKQFEDSRKALVYIEQSISEAILAKLNKSSANQLDDRKLIILFFIAVPSVFKDIYKIIMIVLYYKKGLDIDFFINHGWLSKDFNIKSKAWRGIIASQREFNGKIDKPRYEDAMKYFTDINKGIHRDKVAHDFAVSLEASSKIELMDFKKQIAILFHSLAKMSHHVIQMEEVTER